MTNRAQVAERHAGLWTPFGVEYATRLFGADALVTLPRFSRGKHKGQIKAVLVWRKVERGGWMSEGVVHGDTPVGHVERRVGRTIYAALCECDYPNPYGRVITWIDPTSGEHQ